MTVLADIFNLALGHHRAGRSVEAARLYQEILSRAPEHVSALHLLGLLEAQRGQPEAAIAILSRALALEPENPGILSSQGLALKAAGRVDEALAHYRRALALAPNYANAHNSLGVALQGLGQLAPAVTHYRQALACEPGLVDAGFNLGTALQQQGEREQAAGQYLRVLAQAPDHAGAHNNLANLLGEQGRLDQALVHLQRAVELTPGLAEPRYNLGTVLQQLGRLVEAEAHYRQALDLSPDYVKAHNNLGTALQGQGRPAEAVEQYRAASTLRPDWADPFYNLGTVFQQQGRVDEAAACHQRALALEPGHPKAGFGLCIAQLPLIYRDEAEVLERRAAYRACLSRLIEDIERREAGPNAAASADLQEAVGASQPFYLAYQGYDDRELQSLYGTLVCKIMERRFPPPPFPPPPEPDQPVRVGIVSGFFRSHSNWKIPIRGWLSRLDRRRFQLFGYHTAGLADAETDEARSLCRRFVQGPLPLEQWRREIRADAPHVLIYPEVGMDPMAARLAAQRLARHQCNAWGHPDTSGFPTLDSFLSSDLMEPPDGDRHYSERLVRLPNLSIHYQPVAVPPMALDRAGLGWPPEVPLFWCGQSLFKYLPQFDGVFARIARAAGPCRFVFIEYGRGPTVTGRFRQRLDRAFAAEGLSAAEYCLFLPPLDSRRFVAAIGLCRVVLDSIGWSGCNSTLESLAHDLPIVTLPTPLMRGRHGLAILSRMGVTETIAATQDDYVAQAVRLVREPAWHQAVQRRIAENKHRLYGDDTCIAALEAFLERAAGRKSPSPLAGDGLG